MEIIKKILPFIFLIILVVVTKNNISFVLNFLHDGSQLQKLQKQLQNEEKKNKYLKERLNYVQTDQFVGEEATQKLGMLKDNEFFVIAPSAAPKNTTELKLDTKPNWAKWIDLFF